MKNIKLFMMMAVAAMFAACSDSDINTNTVAVGFESSEITFNESDGMVNIPIKIDGERNGNMKIVVRATDNTAKSEEHYILTDTVLNAPAGENVSLEMRIIDDGQTENPDRDFTLTIVSVEGGTKSDIAETKIVLKDVDAVPFFKLFGTYVCEAVDYSTGEEIKFNVTLNDENENTQEYLYGEGMPDSWYGFETKMIFGFKGEGNLTFENGYWDGVYNFGSFYGVVCYQPYTLSGSSFVPGNTTATYNETYDTITFADGTYANTGVYNYDTSTGAITDYKGRYDSFVKLIKMTKVTTE